MLLTEKHHLTTALKSLRNRRQFKHDPVLQRRQRPAFMRPPKGEGQNVLASKAQHSWFASTREVPLEIQKAEKHPSFFFVSGAFAGSSPSVTQ